MSWFMATEPEEPEVPTPVRLRIRKTDAGTTSVTLGDDGHEVELVKDLVSVEFHASLDRGTYATIVARVDLTGSDFEVQRIIQPSYGVAGLTAEELNGAMNNRAYGGASVTYGAKVLRHLIERGVTE